MLKHILAALSGAKPVEALPPEDCRLALTALMIHVAKADETFADTERAAITQILRQRYELSENESETLMSEAEQVEEKATDTVPLTRLIKDAVPYEERIEVVEHLWEIALADGQRSDDENALLRLVVNLIGVPDRDSGLARQRVSARLA